MSAAGKRLDNLTKPPGSLGRLEETARLLCGIRRNLNPAINKKIILTFAADHGVAAEGVSTVPREVTRQMVVDVMAGGAGVNVLGRHVGAEVRVIDVGVAAELKLEGLYSRKIKLGTDNIMTGPAMSRDEALSAISVGMEMAAEAISDGADILGTGDMGIANTTPSAAMFAALLGLAPAEVTGRGTGIDDKTLEHKIAVVAKALEVNKTRLTSSLDVLAALGGLEIAAICGMIIEAARQRIPVVVDGFISSAGALAAMKMNPLIPDYCFFSHMSAEQGHKLFFEAIGRRPLLHLDLRLGEGTGAALAMNIIEAGVKILTEMATFNEAGVSC